MQDVAGTFGPQTSLLYSAVLADVLDVSGIAAALYPQRYGP